MTQLNPTPWEILEIPESADLKTLKRAYAKKLKQHHPEEDPEGFQRIRAAYEWMLSAFEEAQNPTPPASVVKPRPSQPLEESAELVRPILSPEKELGQSVFAEFQTQFEKGGASPAIAFLAETLQTAAFWDHPGTLTQFYDLLLPYFEDREPIPCELVGFFLEHMFLEMRLEDLVGYYSAERLQKFRLKLRDAWVESIELKVQGPWQTFLKETAEYQNLAPIINLKLALKHLIKAHPDFEPRFFAYLFKALGQADLPDDVVLELNKTFHFSTHFKAGKFAHLDKSDIIRTIDVLKSSFARLKSPTKLGDQKSSNERTLERQDGFYFYLYSLLFFCAFLIFGPFFLKTYYIYFKKESSFQKDNKILSDLKSPENPQSPETALVNPLAPFLLDMIETQHHQLLSEFLDRDFDPCSIWNPQGSSLLHYCILVQNLEAMELLLQYGVDPNTFNHSGFGPLHLAISKNQPDTVTLLLKYQADPHKAHELNPNSPLDLARKLEMEEMVIRIEARIQKLNQEPKSDN